MPRKKVIKATKPADYSNLCASDVLCPICRTILTEPVTLPCNHGFCYLCFNDTMENTNLVCPLCRVRVGSWLRTAKKENRVINERLWSAIKKQYAKEIQNKYDGIQSAIEDLKPVIVVANPGEIRHEYEREKHKIAVEIEKLKIEEEKASTALIKQLQAEDQLNQSIEEEKLKQDSEFAKQLASQLGSPTTSAIKPKKSGPLDKFVVKNESALPPNRNSIGSKEYTCRVLCLDKASTSSCVNTSNSKVLSRRKKLHQQQQLLMKKHKKVWENKQQLLHSGSSSGNTSRSSDVTVGNDSNRYCFQPIEAHKCMRAKVVPLRVVCSRPAAGDAMNIIPPSGITTQLYTEQSAFARYSTPNLSEESTGLHEPIEEQVEPEELTPTKCKNKNALLNNLLEKKNTQKNNKLIINNKQQKNSDKINGEISNTVKVRRISKRNVQNNNNIIEINNTKNNAILTETNAKTLKRKLDISSDSPEVFYGFHPSEIANTGGIPGYNNTNIKEDTTTQTNVNNKGKKQKLDNDKINTKIRLQNDNKQQVLTVELNSIQLTNTTTDNIVEVRASPSPIIVKKNKRSTKLRCDSDSETQFSNRLLQEQYDYEFAKKLQAELNSSRSWTRSRKQRQVTLDEMLTV